MLENRPIPPTMMQNLPQSARALQVAIDAMPVGVSWANLSDQTIIFTNRKFTEMFGYNCGDFRDIADWVERTYPRAEDRDLAAKTWGAYLRLSDPLGGLNSLHRNPCSMPGWRGQDDSAQRRYFA